MQFVPLVPFVAVHLKNCFLLTSCHLNLMSFCTEGLPGVVESISILGSSSWNLRLRIGSARNDRVEGMLPKK